MNDCRLRMPLILTEIFGVALKVPKADAWNATITVLLLGTVHWSVPPMMPDMGLQTVPVTTRSSGGKMILMLPAAGILFVGVIVIA